MPTSTRTIRHVQLLLIVLYSFSHSMFLFAPLELRLKWNIFRPPVSWWTSCPLVKKIRLARSRKRKHQVGLRERQGPTRDIWVYSKWVRKARILWGRSKCARALLRMKSIWNWSCLNLLIYIYFLDNENEKIPCHEWKFTVSSGHAYMVIDDIFVLFPIFT